MGARAADRPPERQPVRPVARVPHILPVTHPQFFGMSLDLSWRTRAGGLLANIAGSSSRSDTRNSSTGGVPGRLGHLRGSTLECPNLADYIVQRLWETGGLRSSRHLNREEPFRATTLAEPLLSDRGNPTVDSPVPDDDRKSRDPRERDGTA